MYESSGRIVSALSGVSGSKAEGVMRRGKALAVSEVVECGMKEREVVRRNGENSLTRVDLGF